MLTLTFIHGNGHTALNQPQSVVISESLSRRFFGDADPVGKTLNANSGRSYSVDGFYTITGVYKDLPDNSTYQFKWLSPYEVFEDKNPWMKPWSNNLALTRVELEPSANPAAINKQLKGYLAKKVAGSTNQCFLFSMNDWKLRDHFTNGQQDGGDIKYVQLFLLIAGIVLLIACINFMNLATARSEQRAKEVGVRKVLGAGKGKLVGQFIGSRC